MRSILRRIFTLVMFHVRRYGRPVNAAAPTLTLLVILYALLRGLVGGGIEARSYAPGTMYRTSTQLVFQDGTELEMQSGATLDIQDGTTAALPGPATFSAWPAAAGSGDLLDITDTAAIMDGSDTLLGIDLNLTGADHTGSTNVLTGLDISLTTADAQATETAIAIDDTDWDLGIQSALNLENLGIPTVASAAITYQSSGALWTIANGEIWIIDRVFVNVTTSFDCTGDNCTLDIGDGNDVDGFIDADDTMLQTAYVDITDGTANWLGMDGAAPAGAFVITGPFVYAPSGAAETIDIAIGGTDPAAGAGTAYITYTRIQ